LVFLAIGANCKKSVTIKDIEINGVYYTKTKSQHENGAPETPRSDLPKE